MKTDYIQYISGFFRLLTGVVLSVALLMGWPARGVAETFLGNPDTYLGLLRNLGPGDTLVLEPGEYDDPNDVPGLPFFNMQGEPDNPIVVTGPEGGPRPVLLGRSTHNTVRFDNASYIVIRNIEIDGRDLDGDGVTAQGLAHHITLENLLIHGVGSNQQVVGISANRAPSWNWVVRNNIIIEAGTGIYFGHPNGLLPFVNGLIEHNLIVDSIGYNMQIKHQFERPDIAGLPTGQSTTIIRHNVFSKANNASSGGNARPNLLVGHFPPAPEIGSEDVYEIYGNFFYQNPSEALFQGEGNVALYDNLFVNTAANDGGAIFIQPQNDVPKMIRIFHNTIIASDRGVRVVGGDPSFQQKVIGNAVFSGRPIDAADQQDNSTDTLAAASTFLVNPFGDPSVGTLDLFPLPGTLTGSPLETSAFDTFTDWDRDFNSTQRTDFTFRGAYAGEGQNPGWLPQLERKPPFDSMFVVATFESPARGQSVAGITVIQGWAFDTQASGQIGSVELFIDGVRSGDIPCCSERGDVQAAFPEFPANNTLNSGWGTIFNWGLLNSGAHTVRVEIISTSGEFLSTQARTVTVVKPGDFEFLDRFDLSGAVANIEGDELAVEGVVVRDKTTLQEREIDARFRWLPNAQSVGMVEAVTVAEISSLRSRVFSLFAHLGAWLGGTSTLASAQAALGIASAFESPDEGQAVFGVGIVGGWAFAEETEAAVTTTRLVIDGMLGSPIPYGSERGDVAATFPGNPNALTSGWGITFNYGLLSPGFHTVGAQIESSTGASLLLEHGVVVVKPDGFEFLDQFDVSGATAQIEGEEIIVEGVWVRDKISQQITLVDVALRWFMSSQALGIVSFAE